MPRTGLKPDQLKEKAILFAEKQIRTYGANKVRLVDVAKEIGIVHTSLYNHFADKTALLDSVSEKWTKSIDRTITAISERDESPTKLLQQLFLTLYRMKYERVSNDIELFKVFDLAVESKKPFIARHFAHIYNTVLKLVTRAMKKGELIRASPERITRFLMEITQGFTHPKLVLEHLDMDRESMLKFTMKMAIRSLS